MNTELEGKLMIAALTGTDVKIEPKEAEELYKALQRLRAFEHQLRLIEEATKCPR